DYPERTGLGPRLERYCGHSGRQGHSEILPRRLSGLGGASVVRLNAVITGYKEQVRGYALLPGTRIGPEQAAKIATQDRVAFGWKKTCTDVPARPPRHPPTAARQPLRKLRQETRPELDWCPRS